MSAAHTPGPWRWEVNMKSKSLHLVGGKPMFDLTIIELVRWGMGSATLLIRDTAHDGMNIMHKLHERDDWWAAFPGRGHHADWCAAVKHPDMQLIEAAPDLLAALQVARQFMSIASDWNIDEAEINGEMRSTYDWLADVDAGIAKAIGAQA